MSEELRVGVTGAGGFIGGEICDYLADNGFIVRPLFRSLSGAARLSIRKMDYQYADVMKPDTLVKAFEGLDAVVHCAYGNTQDFDLNEKINVIGSENVVKASAECGVKRLVHMSTVSVYGIPLPEVVTEATLYKECPDVYGRSKQAAEKLILERCEASGIEAVALQPGIVYGPWAGIWTVGPIKQILTGDLFLYGGGEGICNQLFITDLCRAVELALTKQGISGERYLINGGAPATWGEFFGRYAAMLGRTLPTASASDVKTTESKKAIFSPAIKAVQKTGKIVANAAISMGMQGLADTAKRTFKKKTKWLQQTSIAQMEFFCDKAVFDISHARESLGYEPAYTLEQGMEITKEWLRFVRLVN